MTRIPMSMNFDQTEISLYKISSLKLKVPSRKASLSGPFLGQKSNLENMLNDQFLIRWKNYHIDNIYVNPNEDLALINLKKAISGLFQLSEQHTNETDVTGYCSISYKYVDTNILLKRKRECNTDYLSLRQHPEKLLGVNLHSRRDTMYQFGKNLSKVTMYEKHEIKLNADGKLGILVTNTLDLNFIDSQKRNTSISRESMIKVIREIETKAKCKLKPQSLLIKNQPANSDYKLPTLQKLLKEKYNFLKEDSLGTGNSTSSFLTLLRVARNSTQDSILKVIKNSKNKPILNQLMDILGSAHTVAAHEAVIKSFDLNVNSNLDYIERYLWALSNGCCPEKEIIYDIIKLCKTKVANEKLKETLILTLTSLVQRYSEINGTDNKQMMKEVLFLISDGLSQCVDDQCLTMYLRTYKSLRNPSCKSTLINYALTGSRIISVSALKAVYALGITNWDEEVLKAADNIYYQKKKKFDSSARTIALDILLEGNPSIHTLKHLLHSLYFKGTAYEIKTYLVQRIQQLASRNDAFAKNINSILVSENLNHYGTLAQRGLSTALTTTFFEYGGRNATLYSVNEVSKAVIKRSSFSVSLEHKEDSIFRILSLDIFTGGLSSFLWSSDDSTDDELDEAEQTTAGMELTIFGNQIRPFIFFSGQGELIGHVWSGTASERTPIFQALTLLHDHRQLLSLGTGDIVELNLLGGSSFNLLGKIQFSLWNRNAHSLVQSNSGTMVRGWVVVGNSFFNTKMEFTVGSEFILDIHCDLDFNSEINLCLQLSQPEASIKYKLLKTQLISNSEYKYEATKQKMFSVPGRTYALSKKNNEMCNGIFPNS